MKLRILALGAIAIGVWAQNYSESPDIPALRNGTGAPAATLGTKGDLYLDSSTLCLYGPRTTAWPASCTSLAAWKRSTITATSAETSIAVGTATVLDVSLTAATTVTFTGGADGQLFSTVICQDATGGHALTWGAGIIGASPVETLSELCTVQAFLVRNGSYFAATTAQGYDLGDVPRLLDAPWNTAAVISGTGTVADELTGIAFTGPLHLAVFGGLNNVIPEAEWHNFTVTLTGSITATPPATDAQPFLIMRQSAYSLVNVTSRLVNCGIQQSSTGVWSWYWEEPANAGYGEATSGSVAQLGLNGASLFFLRIVGTSAGPTQCYGSLDGATWVDFYNAKHDTLGVGSNSGSVGGRVSIKNTALPNGSVIHIRRFGITYP